MDPNAVEIKTLFIPAKDVGLLETQVPAMACETLKRKRVIEFNQVAGVLKGLRLVPRTSDITCIAWGVSRAGEVGLAVFFYELSQARGNSIPGEPT